MSLLAIRERELDLYTENCRNIGAQAALLAGFAYSALTFEIADVDGVCTADLALKQNCDVTSVSHSKIKGNMARLAHALTLSTDEWDRSRLIACLTPQRATVTAGMYQLVCFCSMMLNFAAAFGSTFASMLGPGLALRGQDGAMDQAVEGLALEYRTTFILFLSGILSYFLCFLLFFSVDYDPKHGWTDLFIHIVSTPRIHPASTEV